MSSSLLTRSNSSLLRSSPTTIRSSIHHEHGALFLDVDDHKKTKRPPPSTRRLLPPFSSFLLVLFAFVSSAAFYLSFSYFHSDGTPATASENLLLSLIFIGAVLCFLSRSRPSIYWNRNLSILKSLCGTNGKRLSLPRGRSVLWYIGDSDGDREGKKGMTRQGVEFYSNGDFYEGEFHKGRCNGSGVYNYFARGRYEGDWVDGKYDGHGIESWARGSKYRGRYRNGLRHGYGVYRFYAGDSYSGEWWNGQSHGVGVQSCKDGSCYIGEFNRGVKHGLGCYYFRNGDMYAGEYFNDRIHGFGVYQFANGHSYEGSWHEGFKQGYGLYAFRSGVTKCGEWDSGNLKTPAPPSSDAALGAVQAARKAAENAIHLRRVDEQVNKAVLAASRAATAARVAAVKAVQNRMDGKFCDIEA